MESYTFCKSCHKKLLLNHSGPCPFCNEEGRNITINPDTISLKAALLNPTLIKEGIRKYYKKSPKILYGGLLTCIILALVSYFIKGIYGLIVSMVISIIFLVCYPAWKICHINTERTIYKPQD